MYRTVLIGFILLFCSIGFSAYGQTANPYPPPTDQMNGADMSGGIAPYVPGGETMLADLVLVRPMGIVASAIGLGASILATPLTLPSGTTHEVFHRFMVEPFDYTFRRPLGAF